MVPCAVRSVWYRTPGGRESVARVRLHGSAHSPLSQQAPVPSLILKHPVQTLRLLDFAVADFTMFAGAVQGLCLLAPQKHHFFLLQPAHVQTLVLELRSGLLAEYRSNFRICLQCGFFC